MRRVYLDLSGDADLYRDAFPTEKEEVRRAIASAARKTCQQETAAGLVVSSYELEDADFDRAVAPWRERLDAVLELHSAAVINTHEQWVMVREDIGYPLVGFGLLQARIKAVLDPDACGGPVLCLESLEDGSLHVQKMVGKVDARRQGTDEYLHSQRARDLYASALERSAPSSELAREKMSLILGSDCPKVYDVLSWHDVVGSEGVVVLTDELASGLGHLGRGRALYRVRERCGATRLVVEQVSSRTDGYAVKYDWVQDVEAAR